eukprot:scaffold44506_cov50-Phaeocystis_antarctica.AAC.1
MVAHNCAYFWRRAGRRENAGDQPGQHDSVWPCTAMSSPPKGGVQLGTAQGRIYHCVAPCLQIVGIGGTIVSSDPEVHGHRVRPRSPPITSRALTSSFLHRHVTVDLHPPTPLWLSRQFYCKTLRSILRPQNNSWHHR